MNLIRPRRATERPDPAAAPRQVAEAAAALIPRSLPDPADEHERAESLSAEAAGLRASVPSFAARGRGVSAPGAGGRLTVQAAPGS